MSGLCLRDGVRRSAIQDKLGAEPLLLNNKKELVQMLYVSAQDAS